MTSIISARATRMIAARDGSASTKAGSTAYCTASQTTANSPASSASTITIPVAAAGGAVATDNWPLVGSQPSQTPNTSCSSSAAQNAGSATPETASMRAAWSNQWFRRTAASIPAG